MAQSTDGAQGSDRTRHRIRPASHEDRDVIAGINRRAWSGGITTHELLERRHGPIDGRPWVEHIVDAVTTHLAELDVTTLVAEHEGGSLAARLPRSSHLYDREHPDVHPMWREFRQLLDAYSAGRPRAAFGEIHVFDWPEWARYYGEQLDELHMPFNMGLVGIEWKVRAIRQVVDSIEAAIPPGAWPNYMLDNFDESRIASRYGRGQARVAAMLLLTLRGTPTLCYGEEIGMANVPIPPELEQDPFGLRVPGLGRDPFRTPMQWTPGPNAGFSAPGTPRLWLPLAADYAEANVERQLADPTSILNLYRRLLSYRRATPALQWGDYRPLDDVPEECYVYVRQAGDPRILVALNFSDQEQRMTLRVPGKGKIVISSHLDREEAVDLAELVLRGNEGVIVELS